MSMNQLNLGFLDKFPLWTVHDQSGSIPQLRTKNGLMACPLMTQEKTAATMAESSSVLTLTTIDDPRELHTILKDQKDDKGISYVILDPSEQLNTVIFILDLIDVIEQKFGIT